MSDHSEEVFECAEKWNSEIYIKIWINCKVNLKYECQNNSRISIAVHLTGDGGLHNNESTATMLGNLENQLVIIHLWYGVNLWVELKKYTGVIQKAYHRIFSQMAISRTVYRPRKRCCKWSSTRDACEQRVVRLLRAVSDGWSYKAKRTLNDDRPSKWYRKSIVDWWFCLL